MDGSEQTIRILGHKVRGQNEAIRLFQRLAGHSVSHLFREVLDHGRTRVMLDDQAYVLARLPDHTFTLTREKETHLTL